MAGALGLLAADPRLAHPGVWLGTLATSIRCWRW